MLARDRKDVGRNAKAATERGPESAAKPSRAAVRTRSPDERTFALPAIDQDRLTMVSLFIVMLLAALNVMLRFPELGAVIASYNQF
jgi:hypothetical protein